MQGNTWDWGSILIKIWQHIDWVILSVGTKGKLINHQCRVLLPPTTSWHKPDPELEFNHKTVCLWCCVCLFPQVGG